MTPRWLSVTHYAQRYDVHRQTVYKWRDLGVITVRSVGRVLRVKDQAPKATPVRRMKS